MYILKLFIPFILSTLCQKPMLCIFKFTLEFIKKIVCNYELS